MKTGYDILLNNETNYTYFGARYYDSDISIWLSVDPLSDKYPSLSPYAYCANNPVMITDPNGMEIETTKTKYKTMQDGSERQLKAISFRRADRIEITHTVKSMKMYDATGKVSSEDMAQAASDIQGEISEYWNTSGRSEDGSVSNNRGQKITVNTVFENNIEVVHSLSEIDRKDHVIVNVSEDWMKSKFGGDGDQMTLHN